MVAISTVGLVTLRPLSGDRSYHQSGRQCYQWSGGLASLAIGLGAGPASDPATDLATDPTRCPAIDPVANPTTNLAVDPGHRSYH